MLDNLPSGARRTRGRSLGALLGSIAVHAALLAWVVSAGRRDGATPEPVAATPPDPQQSEPAPEADAGVPGERQGAPNPPGRTRGEVAASDRATPAGTPGGATDGGGGDAFPPGEGVARKAVPARFWLPEVDSLVWEMPDTLRLRERAEVRLRAVPVRPRRLVARSAGGERVRVRVLPLRHAQVSGAHLEVEPQSAPLQLGDTLGATEWRWTIRSSEAGPQRLDLQVNALVEVAGRQHIALLGKAQRTLVVQATPAQQLARWAEGEWRKVLAAVAVLLLGAWWARRADRVPDRVPDHLPDRR